MIGQITLDEPLEIDSAEWGELVTQIKGVCAVESHGFTNPGTGDVVKITTKKKSSIKINGKMAKRSNLIAKSEKDGELIVAFRLPPFRDSIEFEGDGGAACKSAVEKFAKLVNGEIQNY